MKTAGGTPEVCLIADHRCPPISELRLSIGVFAPVYSFACPFAQKCSHRVHPAWRAVGLRFSIWRNESQLHNTDRNCRTSHAAGGGVLSLDCRIWRKDGEPDSPGCSSFV